MDKKTCIAYILYLKNILYEYFSCKTNIKFWYDG